MLVFYALMAFSITMLSWSVVLWRKQRAPRRNEVSNINDSGLFYFHRSPVIRVKPEDSDRDWDDEEWAC